MYSARWQPYSILDHLVPERPGVGNRGGEVCEMRWSQTMKGFIGKAEYLDRTHILDRSNAVVRFTVGYHAGGGILYQWQAGHWWRAKTIVWGIAVIQPGDEFLSDGFEGTCQTNVVGRTILHRWKRQPFTTELKCFFEANTWVKVNSKLSSVWQQNISPLFSLSWAGGSCQPTMF